MRWIAIAMLSATVAHARPSVVQQSPGGGGDVEGDVAVHRNDDVPLTLGNTAVAPDAKLIWDTSGTHQLQIWLTDVDGGGTDGVPMYWLTGDGTTYLGGDLDLASATSIVENSSSLLKLGGSMTSSHGLGSPNVGVANALEVDGNAYFDGTLYAFSTAVFAGTSSWGTSNYMQGSAVADDGYHFGLASHDSYGNRRLIIVDKANLTNDYGHSAQAADPAIDLHSSTAAATATDEYSEWSWRRLALGGDGGGYGCINETFAYSDMVDGGGASGTFGMTEQIPDGAVVQRAGLHTLTGFTGDTSATITIGDGTDVDRYNTGTPSVFTTNASGVDLGVPSGTAWHDDAATVTVTITSNADFTSVSAGQATVFVCYWTP